MHIIYVCIYYSGDKIENNEMGRACNTYARDVYRDLVGKPEGKTSLGKYKRTW